MNDCKSMIERLEVSIEKKLSFLETATFSSVGGLSVHSASLNIDLKELDAQINDLRSSAILYNDSKKLEESNTWIKKQNELTASVHTVLLNAKKRLGNRRVLLGKKKVDLEGELEKDLKSKFGRVEKGLKESVEKSTTANTKLTGGTGSLKSVGRQYKEFEDVVDISKRLIRHYAKREEHDWRMFMFSLGLFFFVIGIILYLRMPFIKSLIVPLIYKLLSKTTKKIVENYQFYYHHHQGHEEL